MNRQATSTARDPFYDMAKGFAIFMVILWHVIYSPESWGARGLVKDAVANLIIGCNMPIFFVVAGHFARKVYERLDWLAFLRRQAKLIWPFVVFGVLRVVCEWPEGRSVCLSAVTSALLKFWFRETWFICGLIFCESLTMAAYLIASKVKIDVRWILGAFVLLLLLIPLGFWYSSVMLPFYVLGLYLPSVQSWSRKVNAMGGLLAVAYLAVALVAGNVMTNLIGFYWTKITLVAHPISGLMSLLARFSYEASGVLVFFCLMRLVLKVGWLVRPFAALGTTTLGVYLLHPILLKSVHAPQSVIGCVCVALGILLTAHLLIEATRSPRFVRRLVWGPFDRKQTKGAART